MWYIHPTLGYRKWFHLTQFIWLPEAIDYSPYPGYNGHDHLNQICNWQASVFNDSKSWDYLLYLSGGNVIVVVIFVLAAVVFLVVVIVGADNRTDGNLI